MWRLLGIRSVVRLATRGFTFWKSIASRFFFFSSRRRHTMCLSDWSSDVCSSDLTDTLQVSIRPERPNRRNITVRRRDDADDALRSGPEHVGAFDEMVLAQGMGDEGRQASRDEEGDRGAGASVSRDHAPRVG